MAHIRLLEGLQGIRGAMVFRPETAKPLNELAEALLHASNFLTPGERELIATYVSSQNDWYYCQTVHGAIAAAHLDGDEALVSRVKADVGSAEISAKLKALMVIAGNVQKGGRQVTAANVEAAWDAGATDVEIHDTVLIAAAFCMYTCAWDVWRSNQSWSVMATNIRMAGVDQEFTATRLLSEKEQCFCGDRSVTFFDKCAEKCNWKVGS